MSKPSSKRKGQAVASTLEEIRLKLSCAVSFNDSGDSEEALKYIKDIHVLSYVGPSDYKPLPKSAAATKEEA